MGFEPTAWSFVVGLGEHPRPRGARTSFRFDGAGAQLGTPTKAYY